jgi:hypothetical protein
MLRSGYFHNFKAGPTVLFWGDARAMRKLANLLNSSSIGTGPLGMNSFVNAVDARTIAIRLAPSSRGMRTSGRDFEWAMDADTKTAFADAVEILAEANVPNHQYLTCNVTGEIAVMASCGEYPDDLVPTF